MSKSKKAALTFLSSAKASGFTVNVPSPGVVTITKSFEPGDLRAFSGADAMGPLLLSMLGATRGSQWGTDGGSVGGHSAVTHGCYRLNQSGVALRLTSAIAAAVDVGTESEAA